MNRRALLKAAIILPAAVVVAPIAKALPVPVGDAMSADDLWRAKLLMQANYGGIVARSTVLESFFAVEYDKVFERFERSIHVQHFNWPRTIEVAGALPPGTMREIFDS